MPHSKFLSAAIKQSELAVQKKQGGPFGAIITKNGKLVAQGYCEVYKKQNPLRHAEIVVIEKALKKLKSNSLQGCVLYSSSEPCPMCLAAIYWTGLKAVYFANTVKSTERFGIADQFIYEQADLPGPKRQIPFIHWQEKDSLKPFQDWTRRDF